MPSAPWRTASVRRKSEGGRWVPSSCAGGTRGHVKGAEFNVQERRGWQSSVGARSIVQVEIREGDWPNVSGAQGLRIHVCAPTARRHPPCKLRLDGLARTLGLVRCAGYMRAFAMGPSSRDAAATLHLMYTLQHVVDVAGSAAGHPPFLSSRVSRKHQSLLAPYLDVTVLISNSMLQPTRIQCTQRLLRGATEFLRV